MPLKSTKQRGFTLIELLVVVAVLALITIVVDDLFLSTWRNYQYTSDRLNAEQEARVSVETASKDIRQAIVINSISAQSVDIYKYDNLTDISPVKVEIYTAANELIYKKTTPSGIAPNITYPSSNSTTTKLATHLVTDNFTVFTPYNESNQSLNYSSIGSIKMIGITVKIDMNIQKSPPPFQLDTRVQIRNLKTN